MTLDLEAIKARVEKATPGPWRGDSYCMYIHDAGGQMVADGDVAVDGPPSAFACLRGDGAVTAGQMTAEQQEANYHLMVHCRTDIPALVAEVERLREQVDGSFGGVSRNKIFELGKTAALSERCDVCDSAKALTCSNHECHCSGMFRVCKDGMHDVCVNPDCLALEEQLTAAKVEAWDAQAAIRDSSRTPQTVEQVAVLHNAYTAARDAVRALEAQLAQKGGG